MNNFYLFIRDLFIILFYIHDYIFIFSRPPPILYHRFLICQGGNEKLVWGLTKLNFVVYYIQTLEVERRTKMVVIFKNVSGSKTSSHRIHIAPNVDRAVDDFISAMGFMDRMCDIKIEIVADSRFPANELPTVGFWEVAHISWREPRYRFGRFDREWEYYIYEVWVVNEEHGPERDFFKLW